MIYKKNLGGRPLKFKTVEELQEKVDAYFAHCDPHIVEIDAIEYPNKETEDGKIVPDYSADQIIVKRKIMSAQIPYTITGLAIFLGTSRETLTDYRGKKGYSYTLKAAKDKCENFAEEYLYNGKNTTGAIFNLKNNYGWKDKTEQDVNHEGQVQFINDIPRPPKND